MRHLDAAVDLLRVAKRVRARPAERARILACELDEARTLQPVRLSDAVDVGARAHTQESKPVLLHLAVFEVGQDQRLRRRPEARSEEHTSELQSRENIVCRLLLEKKQFYCCFL